MKNVLVCLPKALPKTQWVAAAQKATEINPVNHAPLERLAALAPDLEITPAHIAVVTTKYWRSGNVRLTVGFMDNPPADLRARILLHMNAWGQNANVKFVASQVDPQVRIARMGGPDGGFWSYVGTDILMIDMHSPTMNLEAFTMQTPESEFHRVVRHEAGHTLGFPHEHMRSELVDKIDTAKAIAFFAQTQGWTPQETRAQVLTPISEGSLMGTPHADPNSIMCYQIPGTITKDGQPIVGGLDIDPTDFEFVATIYPMHGGNGAPAAAPRAMKNAMKTAAKKAATVAKGAKAAKPASAKRAMNGGAKRAAKPASKVPMKSALKGVPKRAAKATARRPATSSR